MLSREDYRAMSIEGLRKVLEKAREDLADIEETFEFTCANTNAHLADAMIEEFDVELQENREFVKMLKGLLAEKDN